MSRRHVFVGVVMALLLLDQRALPFSPFGSAVMWRSRYAQPRSTIRLSSTGNDNNPIESSLEVLQAQLTYIEALEERNKAQLDSFVDEQDQWESLEPFEQELLLSKNAVIEQIAKLSSDSE